MKKLALVLLFSMFSTTLYGALPDRRTAKRVVYDLEHDRERTVVAFALGYMLRVAERRLVRKGYTDEAKTLLDEWETIYAPHLLGHRWELGDHAPMSEWLAEKYDMLEALLGARVMSMTHLDDIKIVNYGVPVSFDPCNVEWDKPEYALHFVPLSGVAAYWAAWGACMAGTTGMGYSVICTPIGTATENLVVNYVAPKVSDRIYDRRCGY